MRLKHWGGRKLQHSISFQPTKIIPAFGSWSEFFARYDLHLLFAADPRFFFPPQDNVPDVANEAENLCSAEAIDNPAFQYNWLTEKINSDRTQISVSEIGHFYRDTHRIIKKFLPTAGTRSGLYHWGTPPHHPCADNETFKNLIDLNEENIGALKQYWDNYGPPYVINYFPVFEDAIRDGDNLIGKTEQHFRATCHAIAFLLSAWNPSIFPALGFSLEKEISTIIDIASAPLDLPSKPVVDLVVLSYCWSDDCFSSHTWIPTNRLMLIEQLKAAQYEADIHYAARPKPFSPTHAIELAKLDVVFNDFDMKYGPNWRSHFIKCFNINKGRESFLPVEIYLKPGDIDFLRNNLQNKSVLMHWMQQKFSYCISQKINSLYAKLRPIIRDDNLLSSSLFATLDSNLIFYILHQIEQSTSVATRTCYACGKEIIGRSPKARYCEECKFLKKSNLSKSDYRKEIKDNIAGQLYHQARKNNLPYSRKTCPYFNSLASKVDQCFKKGWEKDQTLKYIVSLMEKMKNNSGVV